MACWNWRSRSLLVDAGEVCARVGGNNARSRRSSARTPAEQRNLAPEFTISILAFGQGGELLRFPVSASGGQKKTREALLALPAFFWGVRASVKELQSELDLARIVRSVARRTDFAEGRAVVVTRVGDRHNTVAAEVRCVEIRVVGDVEDFRTELQAETLLDGKVLEEGQVDPVEARSGDFGNSAQSGGPG